MVAAVTRLMTSFCLTTWSALAKAASVAALSPISSTKQTLSGASSHTLTAPGLAAASVEVMAGRGSKSTATISAASSACATVSATTKATQSPTQRTRSSARIG